VNPVGRSSGLSEPGYNPCASRGPRCVIKPTGAAMAGTLRAMILLLTYNCI